MSTCYDQFTNSLKSYRQHDFIYIPSAACNNYSDSALSFSYAEANEHIGKRIEALREAGYGSGDRIATVLENRPEFFFSFLALNAVGASIVPVHPDLSKDEKRYLIEHCDAAAVIALPQHMTALQQVCAGLKVADNIVDSNHWADLQRKTASETITAQETDEAAILYTSGTTGKPKGCILSNAYFINWGQWYQNLGGMAALTPGQERLITPLPTNHQNALACSFMGMLMSGGCVVQLDRFSPSSWWASVRESQASIVHYLGVMPAMLLNQEVSAQEDFSDQIKFGLGAGVDPKHHAKFEQRFGFPLLEGWAMTETSALACIMAAKEPRQVGQRCIGAPPASLDWRIVDEDGLDCPINQPGELLVRAKKDDFKYGFFSEYYKNPEATREAWEGDYFHTGDVVRCDEAGLFYFVDRRKNVIRRSGENIAAIEVEASLLRHNAVKACAVTAVPDEIRGEEILALIILDETASRSNHLAREIQQFVTQHLVYFKAPGHIAFVDQLPVGATQKVKRGEIKALSDQIWDSPHHYDLCQYKKRGAAQT